VPFASAQHSTKGLFVQLEGPDAGKAFFGEGGSQYQMWLPIDNSTGLARVNCNPTNRKIDCGWSVAEQLCVTANVSRQLDWIAANSISVVEGVTVLPAIQATDRPTQLLFQNTSVGACDDARREKADAEAAAATAAQKAADAERLTLIFIVGGCVVLLLGGVFYKVSRKDGKDADDLDSDRVMSFDNPQYDVMGGDAGNANLTEDGDGYLDVAGSEGLYDEPGPPPTEDEGAYGEPNFGFDEEPDEEDSE
jgi:hypothetical protein